MFLLLALALVVNGAPWWTVLAAFAWASRPGSPTWSHVARAALLALLAWTVIRNRRLPPVVPPPSP